jgi:hypothetical protein
MGAVLLFISRCPDLEAKIYFKILFGKECFLVCILSAGRYANHGCKQACHKADMAVRIYIEFPPISVDNRFLLCMVHAQTLRQALRIFPPPEWQAVIQHEELCTLRSKLYKVVHTMGAGFTKGTLLSGLYIWNSQGNVTERAFTEGTLVGSVHYRRRA